MNTRKAHLFRWLLAIILIAVLVALAINRQWVYDYARGMIYNPSSEMVKIRKSLNLTARGEFLFNAAWPKLSTRDEFNAYCRKNGEEIAILGCYTGGNIYVFDVTDERLKGIRELTAAHELLHVNFARMSDAEREALRPSLEKTYKENEEILKGDLETYDEAEKFEELYVRAGTEVMVLPKDLEDHYAELFIGQDMIVSYYNSYIRVFREIEAELDDLTEEMKNISNEIESKTTEYERRAASLNTEIESFNDCAQTAGCFTSQWEFSNKRNALVAEQSALDALYEEVNNLVDEYNVRVEKYNSDVLESEKLNEIINSSVKPQEIK